MRYFFVISLLITASPVFGQSRIRHALFLGNSYTYVNNLPQLIADAAASTGDTLIFDSHTVGGYSLDLHVADSNSTNLIKAGGWDYVILQDQSQLPALPDYDGAGASHLCSLIQEYNPCARTLFYMTWGRQNGDALNCADWPPVCTYEGMDSLLRLSYMELASINHAEVSPVGVVWNYIRRNYPGINLYQPDESHPSFFGTYAAACSFYTSIFKKDPGLITYNWVIDSANASIIKNAARTIIYDSLQNWYFENDLPVAEINYTIGSRLNEVNFINASLNAEMYSWSFGDGDTSTATNPSHQYLADGSYQVTLIASSCDLTQVYQSMNQVTITFCPFSPTIFPDSLMICPNTSDTLWTQVFDAYQWFDSNGDAIANEINQFFLPADGGSFSVLATQGGCSELSQPVLVNAFHPNQSFIVYTEGNLVQPDTACIDDTLNLILLPNKPPYPDDHNIQWFKNGVQIPTSGNDTLIVTSTGNYSVSYYDSSYCPGNLLYASPPLPFTFIVCNIGVQENNERNSIIIYPNPAEEFRIEVIPQLIGVGFTLTDLAGRIIRSGKFEQEINLLNMQAVDKGLYILKIGQANVKAIKLMKE